MIQYNPYYQSLLDKDYDFIHSKKGIQLRINRSIQIEGAFGTVKRNYEYRRVRHTTTLFRKRRNTYSSLLKKEKTARLIKVRLKTDSWHFSRK